MRARTNIALKERRKFTLGAFRGVDLSSSPLRADAARATEGCNWIREGGIMQKRHGWTQILPQFKNKTVHTDEDGEQTTVYQAAPINGIFALAGGKLLVCAGTELFCATPNPAGEYEAYERVTSDFPMSGNRVQGFFGGDGIYLLDGEKYHFFHRSKSEAKRVTPYVPTTTHSIDPVGSGDPMRASLEEPNLLTRERKNTLIGSPSNINDSCRWQLDAKIARNASVTVTVETAETLTDEEGNETVTLQTKTYRNNGDDKLYLDGSDAPSGSIYRDVGQITLNRVDTAPPVENVPNITVEFTAASVGDFGEDVIDKCRFGTVFGIDGAEDRLFLSGNPDYPNVVFFSESDRYDYFPARYTATFGTRQSAVTGFLRLSDDVQAVFKEKAAGEAAVYYQSGHYQTIDNDAGEVERITPIFSITAGSVSECAVSPCGIANLMGDSMFVSDRGVFALELTENLATNVRAVRERGRTVEKHLRRRNLREAVAAVHDGRYYLAEGGFCYVADSRCRYQPEDGTSYCYEWQLWNNIPARVFSEVNGALWFGTADGRVCRFETGYSDRTVDVIPTGEITVDYENNCMIFSDRVKVAENDRIVLPDAGEHSLWRLYAEDFELTEDPTRFRLRDPDAILNVFEGDTVRIETKGAAETYSMDVQITAVNRFDGSFSLCDLNGEIIWWIREGDDPTEGGNYYVELTGTATLYKRLIGEYRVTRVGEVECVWDGYSTRNTFRIKQTADENDPTIVLKSMGAGEADVISETLIREVPVVARWLTPLFDMGDCTASKTLLSLTVTQDATCAGRLSFGAETRMRTWEREVEGVGAFSFENLDFSAFTMETGFQNSFTAPIRLPFNYIRFYFESKAAEPCSLDSLAAIYKINKRKKGVM